MRRRRKTSKWQAGGPHLPQHQRPPTLPKGQGGHDWSVYPAGLPIREKILGGGPTLPPQRVAASAPPLGSSCFDHPPDMHKLQHIELLRILVRKSARS
jgi:hypothetical protein